MPIFVRFRDFLYGTITKQQDSQLFRLYFNFIFFSVLTILPLLIFGLDHLLIKHAQHVGTVELLLSSFITLNLIYFKVHKRIDIASNLYLGAVVLAMVLLLVTGGIERTGIYWYFAFPIAAFFLVGSKKGSLWVALLLYLTSIILILSVRHIIVLPYTFVEIRQLLIIMVLLSVSIFIYERDREKSQVEQEYKKLNERFKALIENSQDVISLTDAKANILYTSDSIKKVLGYTQEEFNGQNGFSYVHPEDQAPVGKLLQGLLDTPRSSKSFEVRVKHKIGIYRWLAVNITNLLDDPVVAAIVVNYRDITDKKIQQEESNKLASIVENSADAIVGKTLDGTINSWNKGAEKLYGYKKSEIMGKSNRLLIPEDKSNEWDEFVQRLKRGEVINNYETVRIDKNGKRIDVAITFSPVVDIEDKVVATSAIVRDISDRKRIDEMKNEFVFLASHQLKTPLTSIRWYSEMLLGKKDLDEKEIDYLKEIYSADKRMIDLVNALLNVSRIELGTFMIDPKKADLEKSLDTILETFKLPLTEKQIEVKKNYQHHLPEILIDENLFHIIFSNLISNAIKYTKDKGEINISTVTDGTYLKISISDNGVGIPRDDQSKVFGKFFRAENAKQNSTDGSGLGLYIVKSIIFQAGGNINFVSEEDKGTTFTVSIPLTGMKKKTGYRQLH